MRKIICILVAIVMLVPFVLPAQAGDCTEPSVAIWVNGSWVAAKSVSGLSGDQWIEFPIAASILNEDADNYVRLQTNVANGSTADTQLRLYFTDCGWTNTLWANNWWVDEPWTWTNNCNAEIAIEGWNGSAWVRIHDDSDCNGDHAEPIGQLSDSSYQAVARNIWTAANVLQNYTNFRIRAHMSIGSNLSLQSGDIMNLFPAANYHECTFCPTCGGCLNPNCTLNHVACSCPPPAPAIYETPSIAVWVNGNWVAAKSLSGLSGDMWVEFPIASSILVDSGENGGGTNYVRITSNVANGATAATQLNLLGTACGWSNTYISHNWWVDSDWAAVGSGLVNADLAIEGWNGSAWIRIHNDHECAGDTPLTMGYMGGSDYQGYARNIWTENNTLQNYTNFRIRAHFNIGTDLSVQTGDILNLFPTANYHTCAFCPVCGGCLDPDCDLNHVPCSCELDIVSASLRLDEDIDVIYTVLIPNGYTNAYMVVNGTTITASEAAGNYQEFVYTGITPQRMTDNISATLYATKDDVVESDTVANYSIKQYCSNMLTANPDNAALKTLLSDLLTYGAAAQNYTNYNTNDLATAGLTLTPSTFSAISGKSVSFTGTADSDTYWSEATLVLGNTVGVRLYFYTDAQISIDVTIGNSTESFDSGFVSCGNGRYYLDIPGIEATDFDTTITAEFYDNGMKIGNTLGYSVNTYICGTQNTENTALRALVRALYNYGASAAAYAAE